VCHTIVAVTTVSIKVEQLTKCSQVLGFQGIPTVIERISLSQGNGSDLSGLRRNGNAIVPEISQLIALTLSPCQVFVVYLDLFLT